MKKRLAIRSHGSKNPAVWFSGGQWLLNYIYAHEQSISAEVALVVSPFSRWSAAKKTALFNQRSGACIPHVKFSPKHGHDYISLTKAYDIDMHIFSGWLKLVSWLPAHMCVNIHPWPIQVLRNNGQVWHFGWKGMWGDAVHQKVREAYCAWVLNATCLTMHYMTEHFDDPRYVIAQCRVPIVSSDTDWLAVKKRLRHIESYFQQYIVHQLITGSISFDNDLVLIDKTCYFPWTTFGGFVDLN